MGNLLGVYWSVMHRPPQHYDFLRRLQPAVLKIMDGGAPDYAWAYANLPDALIIARDHPLSEQHDDMLRDPAGTGVRHAREWDQHANRLGLDRKRTLVLGINEPRVWEPGVPEALRQYTIAMCDEGARLGLRVGAKQLSVGWPGNNGADTPPDWSQWHGVEDAIKRGNHVLVLHEYWADQGPFENWGWWGGRGIKCPWQVPIVIGECGIDMYVKDGSVDKRSRGWIGRVSPGRYADELWEFNRRWAEDERFEGSCVYALDCADCETWGCFNVESACDAILALPAVQSAPVSQPVTVHLPIVEGQPVSQQQGIIDPLVLEAILQVESGGDALGADGRPIIRFECHIFKRELGNDALYDRHFSSGGGNFDAWQNRRMNDGSGWKSIEEGGQARQWEAFNLAASLNYEAAARSISMGAAQIMGFNHASIGYPSARAMLEAFGSEPVQVIAFINFILGRPELLTAVRNKDWRTIARIYNGNGAVDRYAPILQGAYERLKN